ncbi:MAG: fibronectin type III domain-containing protein, partial [Dehalococcoidia bacterium]|nr:fibronectin type III domain-containing protein [Dehalococcoidia bacterium]
MDSDKGVIAHFTIADMAPPVISEVTVSEITETTAIVIWITDEPATSQVDYGKTTDYELTAALDEKLVTSHSISLSGLEPNTTYHFRVKSVDKAGNEAISGDYIFTTSKPVPKVEVQILEHHLVREDYPPPASFSQTFNRDKVTPARELLMYDPPA